jgi:ribosomal protein L4
MTLLSKDQILAAEDLPFQDVEVPEWGGTVRVRAMTGKDRDEFEKDAMRYENGEIVTDRTNYRAKFLAKCVVNEKNELLFTAKDVEALGKKSYRAIDKVFSVAIDLSGVSKKEADNIKNG